MVSALWQVVAAYVFALAGGAITCRRRILHLATHAVTGEILKHGKKFVLTSFSTGVAVIAIFNVALRLLG